MLASFEHIVPIHPLTWRIATLRQRSFERVWHFHPEFELTYVRRGHGTRLIGDSVGDYAPGDLTLIGPEVPHTYVSTSASSSSVASPGPGDAGDPDHVAVVVQFRRDFLGEGFFDNAVFEGVATMLENASRGLSFTCEDAVVQRLEQLPPAEKTLELLGLLLDLSHREPVPLASGLGRATVDRATAGRIASMVELIHAHHASPLTLADVAAAAHLTPSSASRLFSRSTGSGISTYLNVVRVNAACRLLRDTDLPVSGVALQCGFSNLSNFNRRFRDVKSTTPREYRARFRTGPPRARFPRPGSPSPASSSAPSSEVLPQP